MPSTWPGIEPAALGIEGQRYTNSPTRSTPRDIGIEVLGNRSYRSFPCVTWIMGLPNKMYKSGVREGSNLGPQDYKSSALTTRSPWRHEKHATCSKERELKREQIFSIAYMCKSYYQRGFFYSFSKANMHALMCINRLLKNIMNNNVPFGEKITLLGGDFRQPDRSHLVPIEWQQWSEMEALIPSPAACEVRSVIKFFTAQSIAPIEIHRQLCQVYGPNIKSKQMVRRWCRQFSEGRQSVHDEERSGRPSLINDDRVELVR
ncbi:hypothetical protein ANN_22621 [Periplaneta americana]|uniref:Mos1 transposase HTH domain-containing protein n=1 Tax=Periplaneta americana TaxID=6978 RepID=A0ABQ8S8S7_PERAM|nr:hypothetical protein ANN_22621 [Periplaneta americana]